MTRKSKMFLIFCVSLIIDKFILTSSWLMWPEFSILQITTSFSVPVVIPKRKVYFDWGFQMNYQLPFSPMNFYDVSIWPNIFNKRAIDPDIYVKYNASNNLSHPTDVTAGELYITIEDIIVDLGYHETCLLKSVCELAKDPFDIKSENIMAEILHFILSPSLHKSFGKDEESYKKLYEDAEMCGRIGRNCAAMFPMCNESILSIFTKVIYEH